MISIFPFDFELSLFFLYSRFFNEGSQRYVALLQFNSATDPSLVARGMLLLPCPELLPATAFVADELFPSTVHWTWQPLATASWGSEIISCGDDSISTEAVFNTTTRKPVCETRLVCLWLCKCSQLQDAFKCGRRFHRELSLLPPQQLATATNTAPCLPVANESVLLSRGAGQLATNT